MLRGKNAPIALKKYKIEQYYVDIAINVLAASGFAEFFAKS